MLAAQEAGGVLTLLRQDVDQAALSAERARRDMTLLREALSEETQRLNAAAETAAATARRLSEALSQERQAMDQLNQKLDGQALVVVEAVERQSRMVMDASDLAQTQLREAEAALAARAADLAAAAHVSVLDYFGEVVWRFFPALKTWYMRLKSRPSFRPLLADRLPGMAPVEHYADLDF